MIYVLLVFVTQIAITVCYMWLRASLMAQTVKNLAAMWEARILSLDQEDPLKESMVSHSSSLAWRIPKKEEPGGLQSLGLQGVRLD